MSEWEWKEKEKFPDFSDERKNSKGRSYNEQQLNACLNKFNDGSVCVQVSCFQLWLYCLAFEIHHKQKSS